MESQYSSLSDPLLLLEGLEVYYPATQQLALQVERLEVAAGECLVLCGASGSGKSTLLRLLNGLIPEYYPATVSGEILLAGQSIRGLPLEQLSQQVASVFQRPASQFFHQHVWEELVFSCENQGLSPEEMTARLQELKGLMAIEFLLERPIRQLSGGQQQQLALASAIMQGTGVILLDEPSASLDQEATAALLELLLLLKSRGVTLLIAEHHLAYLSPLADRYLYFQEGRLVMDYPASDFLERTLTCREEMELRCYDASPYREQLSRQSQEFANDAVGLDISQLQVRQGGQLLYHIPHLCLAPGQVVGLVGPNGSGKSSLVAYLAGLREDKTARIAWQGEVLSARQRLEKTALVLQDVRLQLFTESVRQELALSRASAKEVETILSHLHLESVLERHPASLSGGEQQRLLLAANLLLDKDIFIFDEPTSGLDLPQMKRFATSLEALKAAGKLVVLISHDEELLAGVCDKVLSMDTIKKHV